jgi:hypothetical protein
MFLIYLDADDAEVKIAGTEYFFVIIIMHGIYLLPT